nr:protein [Spodoptera litura nucleopolyhedrovirus]
MLNFLQVYGYEKSAAFDSNVSDFSWTCLSNTFNI